MGLGRRTIKNIIAGRWKWKILRYTENRELFATEYVRESEFSSILYSNEVKKIFAVTHTHTHHTHTHTHTHIKTYWQQFFLEDIVIKCLPKKNHY